MFRHKFSKKVTLGTDYSKFNHEQWQEYRSKLTTIGGSEVGAVLGIDKYTSPQELFYRKLGLYQKTFDYRLPMAMGTHFEPLIVELVRYHDYDEATFAEQIDKKIVVNQTKPLKKTLFSEDLPGYHLNIDGLVKMNGLKGFGVLEVKYMSQFVLDMWKDSIPPQYFAQAVVYAGALQLPYAVLAIQNGSHSLAVYVVENSTEIYNRWLPDLIAFRKRVDDAIEAIERCKEEHGLEITDADLYAVAGEFEPPVTPDSAKPYLEFMSERAIELETETVSLPTDEELKLITQFKEIKEKKKQTEELENYIRAVFVKRMTEDSIAKIDLGEQGSVTYRKGLRFNVK